MQRIVVFVLIVFLSRGSGWAEDRLQEVKARVLPALHPATARVGGVVGSPVYLRVFKKERILELWLQSGPKGSWVLFRQYPIAGLSGTLGPKRREGDFQAPEGFYEITRGALNPKSQYHLSFNIGYPNAYDASRQYTGSWIMVHGGRLSAGCYAITDPAIEELYLLVEAALHAGQPKIPFHSFPFQMSEDNQRRYGKKWPQWQAFWRELAPGYHFFEQTRRLPLVSIQQGAYLLERR